MRKTRILAVCLLMVLVTVPQGSAIVQFQLSITGPQYALAGSPATISGIYSSPLGPVLPTPGTLVRLYVNTVAGGTDIPITGQYDIAHTFPARGAYNVHAVAEEGRPTQARSPTIVVNAAVPPSAPQNVVATPIAGALSVRITWEPPVDDGGAPITQYQVHRQDGTSPWLLRATLSGSARAHTEPNLVMGRVYNFRVTPVSAVAAGTPAAVPITGDAPAAPLLTATPLHLTQQVRLHVTGAGGPTQQLLLETSPTGTYWVTLRVQTGTSLVYDDWVNVPSAPTFRAQARSFAGNSTFTIAHPTGDLPGVPENVALSMPGRIRLNWTVPADGGPVQGYRILEDGTSRAVVGPTVNGYELSTTPGTHAFTIRAISVLGEGASSEPVSLTLAAATAPTSLAAVVIEEPQVGRVNLTWAAPLDDGGAPILGYRIVRTTLSTGATSVVATPNATTFAHSDGSLADDRTYRYDVQAVTAAGNGAAATVDATVEDFRWRLHVGTEFWRLCETVSGNLVCTDVPDGGTFDRQGTGSVQYSAYRNLTLTRRDVPQAGWGAGFTTWEPGNDELAESTYAVTNATGEARIRWSGFTITPTTCRPYDVTGYASVAGMWQWADGRVTICP